MVHKKGTLWSSSLWIYKQISVLMRSKAGTLPTKWRATSCIRSKLFIQSVPSIQIKIMENFHEKMSVLQRKLVLLWTAAFSYSNSTHWYTLCYVTWHFFKMEGSARYYSWTSFVFACLCVWLKVPHFILRRNISWTDGLRESSLFLSFSSAAFVGASEARFKFAATIGRWNEFPRFNDPMCPLKFAEF